MHPNFVEQSANVSIRVFGRIRQSAALIYLAGGRAY